MNDKIKEIADKIIEASDQYEWTKANQLQKALDSLVKLEIAAVQGELPKTKEQL